MDLIMQSPEHRKWIWLCIFTLIDVVICVTRTHAHAHAHAHTHAYAHAQVHTHNESMTTTHKTYLFFPIPLEKSLIWADGRTENCFPWVWKRCAPMPLVSSRRTFKGWSEFEFKIPSNLPSLQTFLPFKPSLPCLQTFPSNLHCFILGCSNPT